MKHLARFFGGLGLIFLIFGSVAILMFQGQFSPIGYPQFALGLIGVIIFLVYFFRDALQTISRKREIIYGLLGSLIVLFILIGANVIAHSKFGERKFDMTVNKIHSLSPESIQLVKNLPTPISVVAFLAPADPRTEAVKELVGKYTYASKQVSLNVYDPDKEPAKLQQFDAHSDEIIVRNEKTKKTVKLTSLTEQDLSTAIRRVMSAESKAIYFTQGHGEGDLEDDKTSQGLYIAKYLLENEGFKVLPLPLATKAELPKDVTIIVAWGAQRPFSKSEVETLENFLGRGGSLVIGQDPLLAPTKDRVIPAGLEPLLEKYGLEFRPSVILEYQLQLLRGKVITTNLAITDYNKEQPIASRLGKESVTEFSMAQPVLQKANFADKSVKRSVILSSSANSWAETNIASIFVTQKPTIDASDIKGPLPLGQAAEWDVSDKVKDAISKKGRLVVYGNSGFANNQFIQSGFNRDLFLNTFAYLGGEEVSLTIRPKTWTTSTLEIQPSQRRLIYYASLFVIPEMIMCLGMLIWIFRRARV